MIRIMIAGLFLVSGIVPTAHAESITCTCSEPGGPILYQWKIVAETLEAALKACHENRYVEEGLNCVASLPEK